jgi:type IV pilus assembly protein PilY1
VTDPDAMMKSEADLASKVLWEFTAPDMGYSYGAPIVVRTAAYGWVVALTSGYNNMGGTGHLYLLNPRTGALIRQIDTPSASIGLTQAAAYVTDYASYVSDSIYAGDLDGQLWRFDMTRLNDPDVAPTLLARLTDGSGMAQPVTTAPLIEIDPVTGKRFVLAGTGRLLDTSDIASGQVQDFYAIIDGDATAFNAVGVPITRSDLVQLKDLTVSTSLAGSQGWYLDLNSPNYNYIAPGSNQQASTSATGERVVASTAAYNGMVAFSTQLMTSDPCLPTVGNLYVVNFGTGKTALAGNVTYLPQGSVITDLRFVSASDGSVHLLAGNQQGEVKDILVMPPANVAVRLLNWRTVPVDGN